MGNHVALLELTHPKPQHQVWQRGIAGGIAVVHIRSSTKEALDELRLASEDRSEQRRGPGLVGALESRAVHEE